MQQAGSYGAEMQAAPAGGAFFTEQLPPPTHFSIDVECVATGPTHFDRAVSQISLVDQYERVHLNLYIKPQQPVMSYLTPLTGLTEALVQGQGVPLAAGVATLRRALPQQATLVGQNIGKDVEWLGLQEGVDFKGMVDLVGLYRVFNPKYKNFTIFAQDFLAQHLLGWDTRSRSHDAVGDAIKSVQLFNLHQQLSAAGDDALAKAQMRLLELPREASFATANPTFEGVCMGNRKLCCCGAPFFT